MGIGEAVLLIEPDAATRELYRRELSLHYRVLTPPDADAALDLLHAEPVCAVVLEPALPDRDGWEFLAEVRWTLGMRKLPVVVCSVLDERRRAIGLGVSAYLVKPVLPARLLEALRRSTAAPTARQDG